MHKSTLAGIGAFAFVAGVFAVLYFLPASARTPDPQTITPAQRAVLDYLATHHTARSEPKHSPLTHLADCPGSMLCCELGGGGTHYCVENQGKCNAMGGALVDGGWCKSS